MTEEIGNESQSLQYMMRKQPLQFISRKDQSEEQF